MHGRVLLMSLQGMRILLVEDAPDIREVFTVLLRVEGADVAAAASGREAAELANRRDFDVVLSDLGLPDIPGDVLIRQILAGGPGGPPGGGVDGDRGPPLGPARPARGPSAFLQAG